MAPEGKVMSATSLSDLRLLAGFRHLMVPLVRILVRNSVPYRDFSGILKTLYARIALDELVKKGQRVSLAKLAIVTGLTRRELAQVFSEEDLLSKALASNAAAIAHLLQGWHTDPDFTGPYGFPRELSDVRSTNGQPGFSDLVSRYAPHTRSEVMLDELLRVGALERLADSKLLKVLMRTYIPEKMAPELIEVFSRGVRRYVETVDHNLGNNLPEEKRFERWVFPDFGLHPNDWNKFRELVNDRLVGLIDDLDTKFVDFNKAAQKSDGSLSVGVGFYVYKEASDDSYLYSLTPDNAREDIPKTS